MSLTCWSQPRHVSGSAKCSLFEIEKLQTYHDREYDPSSEHRAWVSMSLLCSVFKPGQAKMGCGQIQQRHELSRLMCYQTYLARSRFPPRLMFAAWPCLLGLGHCTGSAGGGGGGCDTSVSPQGQTRTQLFISSVYFEQIALNCASRPRRHETVINVNIQQANNITTKERHL